MALCELCGRDQPLTFHHLIPKALHKKPRYQKRHKKEELRARGIDICKLCHDGLHDLVSARDLADHFSTKETLLSHPPVGNHIAWVKKQK